MAERKVLHKAGANTNEVSPTADTILVGGIKVENNPSFGSGTGFQATLEHANTAPRSYTFPDSDGPVALLADVENASAVAAEAIEAGSLLYVASDGQVGKADQSVPAKVKVIGAAVQSVIASAPVRIRIAKEMNIRMVGGLTLAANDRVFLSTGGRGTNVAPGSGAHTILGNVLDASGYNPIDPDPKALVSLLIQEPILLS